jgi:hypothetical protein
MLLALVAVLFMALDEVRNFRRECTERLPVHHNKCELIKYVVRESTPFPENPQRNKRSILSALWTRVDDPKRVATPEAVRAAL